MTGSATARLSIGVSVSPATVATPPKPEARGSLSFFCAIAAVTLSVTAASNPKNRFIIVYYLDRVQVGVLGADTEPSWVSILKGKVSFAV